MFILKSNLSTMAPTNLKHKKACAILLEIRPNRDSNPGPRLDTSGFAVLFNEPDRDPGPLDYSGIKFSYKFILLKVNVSRKMP